MTKLRHLDSTNLCSKILYLNILHPFSLILCLKSVSSWTDFG